MITRFVFRIGIFLGFFTLLPGIEAQEPQPGADFILEFIRDNPERSAIKLVRNDTVLADRNGDTIMPLASTVKIIVAIEYAKQAARGTINPDEMVPMAELGRYYVPNTDGGAHPAWLASVKDEVREDSIPIREIAKGMIRFSSNANTEWLMERLGLENINSRLDSLAISNHTGIYYLVSALFVGKERFPGMTGEELADHLQQLSDTERVKISNRIHSKLKSDDDYKNNLGDLGLNIQRVWSDNLPASTVDTYVSILQKINGRDYFGADTHQYLDEVMEFLMENPANRQWLAHAGMKGGSTPFVLTKTLYATDKQGNSTELAYFFNDLEISANRQLQLSMNDFELKVLTDPDFRDRIAQMPGR